MLWRCARNCPGVGNNVDFLSEDYQDWIEGPDLLPDDYENLRGNYQFSSRFFYDPDEESEWY